MAHQWPTFLCKPSQDGKTWSFACPYCKCRHTHGTGEDGSALPGHRVAHCHSKEGLRVLADGYMLELAGRPPAGSLT
jgi:hypothetical protein